MKIIKHVLIDITMTGDEHAELVSMLKTYADRLLAQPASMADQDARDRVDIMLDRLESM